MNKPNAKAKKKWLTGLVFFVALGISIFVIEKHLSAINCYCNACETYWSVICFTRGGTPSDIEGELILNVCNLNSCFYMAIHYCEYLEIHGEVDRPITLTCTTPWCEDCDPPAI